jgi:hypothetical protein
MRLALISLLSLLPAFALAHDTPRADVVPVAAARHAHGSRHRHTGARDHREDVRDHREDVRDRREDVRDRREDVRDRRR